MRRNSRSPPSRAHLATLQSVLDREPLASLDPDLVWDLVVDGLLRFVVTPSGLDAISSDGLLGIDGVVHVQDCEVVRLAARGAKRRGDCTCGSEEP